MESMRQSFTGRLLVVSCIASVAAGFFAGCESEDKEPLTINMSDRGAPIYEVGQSFAYELEAAGGVRGTTPVEWAHDELPWWVTVEPSETDSRRIIVRGRVPMGASREQPYELSFQAKGQNRLSIAEPIRISFRVEPFVGEFQNLEGQPHELHGTTYELDLGRRFNFRGDVRSNITLSVNTGGLSWNSALCGNDDQFCLDLVEISDEQFGQVMRSPIMVEGDTDIAAAEDGEVFPLDDNLVRNAFRDGQFALSVITAETDWTLGFVRVVID